MPIVSFLRTETVLDALEEALIKHCGDLKHACHAIQCSIRDVQAWVAADQEAAKRVKAAQILGWSTLEAVAYERAVIGVDHPVYQKGELVGYRKEYSDTLLAKMMAARVPAYSSENGTMNNLTVNVALMPRASSYEEWLVQRDTQLKALPSPEDAEDADFEEVDPFPIRATALQDVL